VVLKKNLLVGWCCTAIKLMAAQHQPTKNFPLVPHAPAWECSLGRVASSSLSCLYAKKYGQVHDATRQGRHSRVRTRGNEREKIHAAYSTLQKAAPTYTTIN